MLNRENINPAMFKNWSKGKLFSRLWSEPISRNSSMPKLKSPQNLNLASLLNLDFLKQISCDNSLRKTNKFGQRRQSMLTLGHNIKNNNRIKHKDLFDSKSQSLFSKSRRYSMEAQDGQQLARYQARHKALVHQNFMK